MISDREEIPSRGCIILGIKLQLLDSKHFAFVGYVIAKLKLKATVEA